ncbi:MAG: phosphatase domain-containing protein [Ginsengibacter sp.]
MLYKEKKISLFKKIKHKIYFWLRLCNRPVIKVYNGYGNDEKVIVIGHVLKLSPMPRKTYRQNWVTNFFSIIRLFCVVPFSQAKIAIEWGKETYETHTGKDGFFRFEIFPELKQNPGWHSVSVHLKEADWQVHTVSGQGRIYIPFASQYAFISDIDDTFLISHSSRIRRRLYVLFTKNERTRKFFDGVIHHYQQLARGRQKGDNTNPFFYVSSSEWNLYDFVVEFAHFNKLPDGIFLLGQIKRLKDFWSSGQNNHATKFMRIVRIIEAYPSLQFILLGDDSQQDPEIYSSIVSHFPGKIVAVYIRRIHSPNNKKAQALIDTIQNRGVACCYFEHSAEAVIHSKMIGLISPEK